MSLSGASSVMAQAITTLERELWDARVEVLSSVWVFGGKERAQSWLSQADRNLSYLRGELRDQVLAGTKAWAVWRDLAVATHDVLGGILTFSGKWAMLPALSSVVLDVGQNIATGAKAALDVAPWVLGAAMVLGLVYLVASARRLA